MKTINLWLCLAIVSLLVGAVGAKEYFGSGQESSVGQITLSSSEDCSNAVEKFDTLAWTGPSELYFNNLAKKSEEKWKFRFSDEAKNIGEIKFEATGPTFCEVVNKMYGSVKKAGRITRTFSEQRAAMGPLDPLQIKSKITN